jgi:hypothetical protein
MEAAGKRYILHGSRSDIFRLWNLADIHWLNKGCAVNDVKRDLKIIANDPFSFAIGGGDFCDFIGYRDKRFDPDAVPEWVPVKALGDLGRYGMTQIRDLFLPIKHKLMGLVIGNHELKYELHTEQESLHHWLCEELGVPSLEYSALFDVVFVRQGGVKVPRLFFDRPNHPGKGGDCETFRIFIHHGAGYAQTPGGKLNRLVQFMQSFDADIYMTAHVHDHVARKEPAIGADKDCTRLVQRNRLGVVAGSYLKTYNQGSISYGEQRGFRPTSLGAAVVRIKPETRELEAVV